jgi:signal peptidase II
LQRFWFAALLALLADQVSKSLVLKLLAHEITIVPGILVLRSVANPGAAFGFLVNQTQLLILLTTGLALAIVVGYKRIRAESACFQWGVGLLFGGALGNLFDRMRFGYVVDFIDIGFWPVFNLADTAIVIGVGLIAVAVWRSKT